MKIALVVGHSKKSTGAKNTKHGLNEHDECFLVGAAMQAQLLKFGHDADFIIDNKVASVNAGHYDLALDLHMNADYDERDMFDLDDTRGHGVMVLHYPKAATYGDTEPESTRRAQAAIMASTMATELESRNLGARAGWWWGETVDGKPVHKLGFLKNTNCPSLTIEFGYIDNNAFAEKYLICHRHDKLAAAAIKGIREAFK